MNTITLNILRFNPEIDEKPYVQVVEKIKFDPIDTVLDILLKVKNQFDSTLTFRYSCKCTICGSCAMRINGVSKLACGTKVSEVIQNDIVNIEPLVNFPVIKDLVVDLDPLIRGLYAIVPWIVRDQTKPLPEKGYIIKPEQLSETLLKMDRCILCGICHFDNTTKDTTDATNGGSLPSPVLMVKALKLMLDPRDSLSKSRLKQLIELGLLLHPEECDVICPKGIDIASDVIRPLKEKVG